MTRVSSADCRAALLALVVLAACSHAPQASPRDVADANDVGRALAGTNASERELLQRMTSLREGVPSRIGDATVLGDAAYAAASGRTCRVVHVQDQARSTRDRLVCTDGAAWFFVPEVFAGKGD